MNRYLILIHGDDEAFADLPKEQVLNWLDLIRALMDSTLEVRQVIDEERSIP